MASFFITGCSRGLGLEIVKQLLAQPPTVVGHIFASSRSATPPSALQDQINASNGRITHVQLDIDDPKSIQTAKAFVQSKTKSLDVLINNAGVQLLEKGGASSMDHLQASLTTNVVSVHNVTSSFLPLLEAGSQKKIVNVSSTLGSIGMREYSALAPFPSYKISKAALNMFTVQLSMQLAPKGFTVFCVSPGWLQTDLGGPAADLVPAVGAKEFVRITLESTPKDNARFRNIHVPNNSTYDGQDPPW